MVPKILIGIQGGVVQWIQSNVPVETLCLDMDTEEGDPKNVSWTDTDHNKSDACPSYTHATVDSTFVERVYKEVLSQN